MDPADKLRLGLLYALRYEDSADLTALKRELVDGGVPQAKVQLVDIILQHAGKVTRRLSPLLTSFAAVALLPLFPMSRRGALLASTATEVSCLAWRRTCRQA